MTECASPPIWLKDHVHENTKILRNTCSNITQFVEQAEQTNMKSRFIASDKL